MNEEFDKNKIPQPVEEQEIDLIELAKKVWANRKLVFKTCGIAVIVALVVAFSIPKEYATSVTLAPETTGKSTGGSMGAWLPWQVLTWVIPEVMMLFFQSYIRIL